jgi:glutaminyl-peptide cyclotransferase
VKLIFFDGEEAFKDWTATDSLYGSRHLAQKWESEPSAASSSPSSQMMGGYGGTAVDRKPGSGGENKLKGISLFVLLDLIGASTPQFYSTFENTNEYFKRLAAIEESLQTRILPPSTSSQKRSYFNPTPHYNQQVEDDRMFSLLSLSLSLSLLSSLSPTAYVLSSVLLSSISHWSFITFPNVIGCFSSTPDIPFLKRGVRCLHLIALPFPSGWHTANDNFASLDSATILHLSRVFRQFVVEYAHL